MDRKEREGEKKENQVILLAKYNTWHVAKAQEMHGEESCLSTLFPMCLQVSPTHSHPVGTGEQRSHTHTVLSSPPRGAVSLRYECLKPHMPPLYRISQKIEPPGREKLEIQSPIKFP